MFPKFASFSFKYLTTFHTKNIGLTKLSHTKTIYHKNNISYTKTITQKPKYDHFVPTTLFTFYLDFAVLIFSRLAVLLKVVQRELFFQVVYCLKIKKILIGNLCP